MPPDDPLGRHGPSLDNFLRKKPVVPEHKKQQCPYGKIRLLNIKTSVPIQIKLMRLVKFSCHSMLSMLFPCREEMYLWN